MSKGYRSPNYQRALYRTFRYGEITVPVKVQSDEGAVELLKRKRQFYESAKDKLHDALEQLISPRNTGGKEGGE